MTARIAQFLHALVLPGVLLAQYSGPESVEYDASADRYLVSNTQSSAIRARSQAGTVTDFATGLPAAPYGLEIMGEVVYAAMGNGVRGYDLATGAEVFNHALGATFPNGITTDGTYLYVTDFSGQRIYKVDVGAHSHTTLVANTNGTPNGIVHDPTAGRLVVVFWGSNAPIKAFDPVTGAATTLVANTGLANIDGVTIDCHGNFVVASWSPDRLTSYPASFALPGTDLGATGLNNPADIDFDPVNNRIGIPNAGNNTVSLFDVDCGTTGLARPVDDQGSVRAVPNPVDNELYIDPPFDRSEPYVLLDGRGLLLGGGELRPSARLDVSDLPQGTYVFHFTRTGRKVRFVKQ